MLSESFTLSSSFFDSRFIIKILRCIGSSELGCLGPHNAGISKLMGCLRDDQASDDLDYLYERPAGNFAVPWRIGTPCAAGESRVQPVEPRIKERDQSRQVNQSTLQPNQSKLQPSP